MYKTRLFCIFINKISLKMYKYTVYTTKFLVFLPCELRHILKILWKNTADFFDVFVLFFCVGLGCDGGGEGFAWGE